MSNQVSLNWLAKPMSNIEQMLALVNKLRTEFIMKIDGVSEKEDHFLCTDSGFSLVSSAIPAENMLNPRNFSGAGELSSKDGHIPILFLAALRKRVFEEVPNNADKLTFCTEEGELIRLDGWQDVVIELKRLSMSGTRFFENVRKDAEAVGFADVFIKLNTHDQDKPQFFF